MKIFLLHGDNTTASYDRLLKYVEHAKKRGWEIVHVSDKNVRLPEVYMNTGLFVSDKLVIVDDYDFLNKRDLKWLDEKGGDQRGNLVIYHDAPLPKTKINAVPKLEKEEKFELPVLLWRMIDNFYPGNAKQFLQLMHEVLKRQPVELVFGLLATQIRNLYWVLVDPISSSMPDWKKSKLQGVAKRFSKETLEWIIEEMAAIDVRSKTTDLELTDLLDFLVVKGLQ